MYIFFFSSRRRHTRCSRDWSSDVCSSDLELRIGRAALQLGARGRVKLSGLGALHEVRDQETQQLTVRDRSEEHTSELQSRLHLVCRLLLEKKKKTIDNDSL